MEMLVTDIEAARLYAIEEGGELVRADHFNWYNRHVGDYPLPKGFKVEDLGKCEYKIKFPGVNYEIGIVKNPNGDGWVLMYDFYDQNLKEKIGGPKALKAQESILKHQTILAAKKKNLKWKNIENSEKNELRIRTYLK
jgi:hypothetical protein